MVFRLKPVRDKLTRASFRAWISTKPTGPVLILIQGFSAWLWWVTSSYFEIDLFASRSFKANDTWCDPESQGLGIHCWGDYYYPIHLIAFENPFDAGTLNPNPYPAAALIPFMFFDAFGKVSGLPGLGVGLYLAFMLLGVFWSIWFGTRGLPVGERLVLFSTLSFLSPPVVMAFDRGNSVGFLVPILVWYFSSIHSGRWTQAALSISLMSVIKPHFALVALAIWVSGRTKIAFGSLLLSCFINLLPFLVFWGRDFPQNVIQWSAGVIGFQDYSSIENPVPQNMSFAQGIYSLIFLVRQIAPIEWLDQTLSKISATQGLWGFVVLALALSIVVTYRKSLSLNQISIILISSISLASATTYYYYGVFAVPCILALTTLGLRAPDLSDESSSKSHGLDKKSISFILWLASIGTLIQIPAVGLLEGNQIVTSSAIVGFWWILAYIVIVVLLIGKLDIRGSKFYRR